MNSEQLVGGCRAFWQREGRDSIYRVATRLITDSWGNSEDVADGLVLLLLVWNQAFYRYGDLAAPSLDRFLTENSLILGRLRERDAGSYGSSDDQEIVHLFNAFMLAAGARGKKDLIVRQSPVSAAKGLHLLAPRFFPLWDDAIARAYGCRWANSGQAASSYLRFIRRMGRELDELGPRRTLRGVEDDLCKESPFPKPLLKFIDEYNYARYTKRWWPVLANDDR